MSGQVRSVPVGDYLSVVDDATQFIDVRESEEVAERSVTGARNIPLDRLPEALGDLDPRRRTVLLCRSGNRSGRAAELLVDHGFVDVINLTGGILDLSEGATR